MKVLQINSVCGYGSTGKIVTDLYHALEEQGHQCCIAYGRGSALDNIQNIKIGNRKDFYFHALITRLFDRHGFGSKRATRKFIQKVKEYDPDVIHLHNIHGYYINIEILFEYLKEANIPILWTLHDCWSFTGHCAHFEPVACEKWKNQCKECPLKKDYPRSLLFDASYKNYNRKKAVITGVKNMTLITPSQWLADVVVQSYLKDYQVETISNGIDTSVFHALDESGIDYEKGKLNRKYGIDFSKKIFLGIASVWTKDKGFDDFIKMAEFASESVQIVMVGINEKQKNILPSPIIAIERTENQKELAFLYACADVFLNPTYADTYPTVNMESLACGTPVVSYNTGGSVEIASVVVPKGDYKEMLAKAQGFKSKEEIKKLCNRVFDRQNCLIEYLQLYEKIT